MTSNCSYLSLGVEALVHGDPDLFKEDRIDDRIDLVTEKFFHVLLNLRPELLVVAHERLQ